MPRLIELGLSNINRSDIKLCFVGEKVTVKTKIEIGTNFDICAYLELNSKYFSKCMKCDNYGKWFICWVRVIEFDAYQKLTLEF